MVKRKVKEETVNLNNAMTRLFDLERRFEDDQKLLEEAETLSGYFFKQTELIENVYFRELITKFLDTQVSRFVFEKPTSSTGKYHLEYQNLFAGNGFHTKNVVKVLQVFERAHPNLNWDPLYAAAILHDCTKYETQDSQYTDGKHALTAAEKFENFAKDFVEKHYSGSKEMKKLQKNLKKLIKETVYNIKWHDGRFNPLNATKEQIGKNYTKKFYKNVRTAEAHLLHLADMISANKPLWEEWI